MFEHLLFFFLSFLHFLIYDLMILMSLSYSVFCLSWSICLPFLQSLLRPVHLQKHRIHLHAFDICDVECKITKPQTSLQYEHYACVRAECQHQCWCCVNCELLHQMPQSGVLILSEEEKRTLISEGYPIPSKLPLTKQEEKNLKKVRRKIKNKVSGLDMCWWF